MTPPLSLSMMKMEKNFVAYLEKKYPRKPYEEYPIYDLERPTRYGSRSLIGFVNREKDELDATMEMLRKNIASINRVDLLTREDICKQIIKSMWEVADVSNTLDYLFEGLLKALKTWEAEI